MTDRHLRTTYLTGAVVVAVILLGRGHGPQTPDRPPVVYTVRAGDTLWDLAGDYAPGHDRRVWIDAAKRVNGWASVPVLHPGQALLLPDWRVETAADPG